MSDERLKVLVKEQIGESGIELLRGHFEVVPRRRTGADEDLIARIGDFDGILIRSATKLDR